jgi:hypothetical protein
LAILVRLTAVLGLVLGIASPAAACPFCNSSTAEQVRAGIFNSAFGYHLGRTSGRWNPAADFLVHRQAVESNAKPMATDVAPCLGGR